MSGDLYVVSIESLRAPAAIGSATASELVLLVTAIVRGERFGDGQIEGALGRGSLLAASRRAAVLVGEHRAGT